MAKVAVVLGSSLGAFSETLKERSETPYSKIEGWPISAALGRPGKLVRGRIGASDVIVLVGRTHRYEAYTPQQVTFGIRKLAGLGIESIVLTNAARAVNSTYYPGQLVLLSDHINLMGANPLTGPNDDSLGSRVPDMSYAYSTESRKIAKQAALELGLTIAEGVYAGVGGPSSQTPAEIRYLRAIGADLVGMSTVPETIVANHAGMRVLGISRVTQLGPGVPPHNLNRHKLLETQEQARNLLINLLTVLVPRLEGTLPHFP